MPGCLARSSPIAPLKKTRPPIRKIAVPNTAGIHWLPGNRGPPRPRMSCSPVENTRVGIVRIRLIQNRRWKLPWCMPCMSCPPCSCMSWCSWPPCSCISWCSCVSLCSCIVCSLMSAPPVVLQFEDGQQLVHGALSPRAALVKHLGHVRAQMVLDEQLVEAAQRLLDGEGLRDDV